MLTHNARPGESGRSAPAPLPASAAGVPIPPRNIKASVGWLWQEKSALRLIAQHYRGDRLRAARSVYLALTEIASNQFTPARAHTSCAYLGEIAGLGENAVRRYLHEFAQLGLLAVEPGIHRANTYLLLAGGETGDAAIEAREMKLADSAGVSRDFSSPRGAVGDPPGGSERSALDTPAPIRATRGGTQDPRIKQNKKEIQTNRGGAVADSCFSMPPGNLHGKANESAMLLIASGKLADSDSLDTQHSALSTQHSITALSSIGVRHEVAATIAQAHDEQQILGWVRYARTAPGLKSRAGFVLAMLRQDQAPPAPTYVNPIWNPPPALFSPPEPSAGLTEASAAAPPTSAPSPSASEQAVWLAAKDELLAAASGGVKLWLQHVRLIRVEADRLVLSSPPIGSYAAHVANYAAPLAELMGTMLGRPLTVEFELGW